MIEDLKKTIEHLEHEETKKADERLKYARDIEQVEEHEWGRIFIHKKLYFCTKLVSIICTFDVIQLSTLIENIPLQTETKDYLTTIKKLQEENRKLPSSLTAATERDSAFSEDESFIEIDLVNKLQGIVKKQWQQIHSLEGNLSDVKSDLEEMKSQNEKLSGWNKDLQRKLRQTQSQLHCLVDERAELEVTLQDPQQETAILARRLGLTTQENEELAQSACTEPNLAGKVIYDWRIETDPDLLWQSWRIFFRRETVSKQGCQISEIVFK